MNTEPMENNNKAVSNDEVSLKEVILNIKGWTSYLIKKWKPILIFLILGITTGILYSLLSTPKYIANSTFALDEGLQAPPAGLAMLGMGGGGSNAGMFGQTKNIMWLYSTKSMLQRTLLTTVIYEDSTQSEKKRLLIDWFMDESGLKKEFADHPNLRNVVFSKIDKDSVLSRNQNTIINKCVSVIKKDYLTVEETKDAVDMISVSVVSEDELFSKLFTEELVKTVNNYYRETKTIKESKEVEVLQTRADSFRRKMNFSIYDVAQSVDAAPYANPFQSSLQVASKQKQVDVQVTSAIFTELMKNLEISKQKLAQATPLINVIESPILPLQKKQPSIVIFPILFGFLFTFFTVGILVGKEFLRRIMSEEP